MARGVSPFDVCLGRRTHRHNVGVQIGRYTVDQRTRKEGGQAYVFFSVDPDTGMDVAIKMARPTKWSRDRMAQEIKVQQQLDHPNILPILDYDREHLEWHVTQRAAGSLEDRGPFAHSEWTALRVGLLGIASAVRHAHQNGRIHRDISPGNVLVMGDRWVVSDWGFVYEPPKKGAPRMTRRLEFFGTPEFMSPEMAVDPRRTGPGTDVFSIGKLAAWGTGLERGESYASDGPAIKWWRQLIDRATAWDPDDRWSILDVETYLRAKLAPVTPAPISLAPPISDPTEGATQLIRISDHRSRSYEPCPQCGSTEGGDATEHCLRCHAALGY